MRGRRRGTGGVGSLIAIVGLIVLAGSDTIGAAERTWTRSEILAITDGKAKTLGYDPEHMSASFDFMNTGWNHYLRGLGDVGGMPNLERALKDRKFLAVYYRALKDQILHEDLWVFLDRNTGEIIDFIPGE